METRGRAAGGKRAASKYPDDASRNSSSKKTPDTTIPAGQVRTARDAKGHKEQYLPLYMVASGNKQPERCRVCGSARATGRHYRLITCEGCKSFFRRTCQKKLTYTCDRTNNCVIREETRNACKSCRYRKCLDVGMDTGLVMAEDQRLAMPRLKDKNRRRRQAQQEEEEEARGSKRKAVRPGKLDPGKIFTHNTAFVHRLATGASMLPGNRGDENGDDCDENSASHDVILADVTKLTANLNNVIPSIPGVSLLSTADQLCLVKTCELQLQMVKAMEHYPQVSTGLKQVVRETVTHQKLNDNAMLARHTLDFLGMMTSLALDRTELVLMAIMWILDADTPGLENPAQVERIRREVDSTLLGHETERSARPCPRFAAILSEVDSFRSKCAPCPQGVLRLLCQCLSSQAHSPLSPAACRQLPVTSCLSPLVFQPQ